MPQIPDKQFIAYDQAIKAYQFQVTRYNTWMNYYALFVGALFVAFYMIICYSQSCSCTCCFCWMCCSCDDELPSTKFLLIFITILGIVASTCWMASLIGNCAWMNNYIKIVKIRENALLGQTSYVYQYIQECYQNRTGKHLRKGFISTQKMTQWFVGAVLAAWIYILISLCPTKYDCIAFIYDYKKITSCVIVWVIWVLFKKVPFFLWSDNLKGMQ